jgi:pyruvate dehydrogenase E2 component (dihydrolipoamide acetyltransferase)
MSWQIGMPNLGHTMEEGTVIEWLKKVGDRVRKGESIVIVESDKANFEVESPGDGILLATHADVGTVVPVGGVIGVVGALGEAVAAPSPSAEPTSHQPEALEETKATVADVAPAARVGRIKMSPAARVLAQELGVTPEEIVASGEDGMITRDDVRRHAERTVERAAGTASRPLSPMRQAIAKATQASWQAAPHVALHSRATISAIADGGTATLTATIARACALALMEHSAFNGTLADNTFRQSANANLSFAVSTPNGLVTAVVPRAETKSVQAIDDELKSLAAKARNGQLDGSHMYGGSFSISSLGRWGIDAFTPIISVPQVAILGVGRLNRVAREGALAAIRFESEITLTLVFDHRANDGVAAAQFLAAIVKKIESPECLESNDGR